LDKEDALEKKAHVSGKIHSRRREQGKELGLAALLRRTLVQLRSAQFFGCISFFNLLFFMGIGETYLRTGRIEN
jgi:hypothetical protein